MKEEPDLPFHLKTLGDRATTPKIVGKEFFQPTSVYYRTVTLYQKVQPSTRLLAQEIQKTNFGFPKDDFSKTTRNLDPKGPANGHVYNWRFYNFGTNSCFFVKFISHFLLK